MQLRKTMMMLTALSALSVVMTGCPGDEESSITCSIDGDCLDGEICHPTAKVCAQTCDAAGECPDSAKSECTAVSATDSRKICKCTLSTLCSNEYGADVICSDLDKVCAPKCTTDASCGTGRTCDTATGQCKAGGNTGTTCTYGSCAAGEVCNATTDKCEAAATCSGDAQSSCTYGQFCSGGKCADAPKPTCGNLEGKPAASFDPGATTSTGNIIYSVEKVSFAADPAGCPGATNPIKVVPRVSFYVKSGTVPADQSSFQGFFYVRTDKGEVPLGSGNLFNYTKAADQKSASVSVFLCIPDVQNVTMGFYFTNGNGYCASFSR
ncbi:hypothetical protein [Hyalangium gracile]|uniref:hypothetical protein n=1 Tax=Hyalangium gracile TaxID=394092 RepID=UPI001CC91AEC|nr:hypothetical protein [Hyalangium gracile]